MLNAFHTFIGQMIGNWMRSTFAQKTQAINELLCHRTELYLRISCFSINLPSFSTDLLSNRWKDGGK